VARDPSQWVVDALRSDDHDAWAVMHRGYLEFYESARPEEVSAVVWNWLMDPSHELNGLVARPSADARPVGIAHYRPFPRPLHGNVACFVDDLFVAPEARGTGAVDALLEGVQRVSREHGWSPVRWVTRAGNERARKVYDRLATRIDLVTYDLGVEDAG
jgi:GNAT superfamily N-acetyltransferase